MSRSLLLVALALASPTIVLSGSCPFGCSACNNGAWDYNRCTSCDAGYKFKALNGNEGKCENVACPWSDEDSEDFYAKLIVGSVIAIIIAIAGLVINSMIMCCGILKEKPVWAFAIGVSVVVTFASIIPFITGHATGSTAVDDYCDRCNKATGTEFCTQKERDDASDAIAGLGVLAAYIHAFGWLVIVLSIITCALGCCICCPCCGPLKTYQDEKRAQQTGAPVQIAGAVVGQPVGNAEGGK